MNEEDLLRGTEEGPIVGDFTLQLRTGGGSPVEEARNPETGAPTSRKEDQKSGTSGIRTSLLNLLRS